jgi:aminopeptidase N
MPSLTRVEAIERAKLLEIVNYRIHLNLTEAEQPSPTFASTTTIQFTASNIGGNTFVDLKAASVTSVVLNGRTLDPTAVEDGRVTLTDLAADNELTVVATMAFSADGEGLHRHVDPADDKTYLYAMSFLDAGPRWFASFDQPDLKATYDVEVDCPPDWTVIGNGAATRTAPGRWTLATTKPLSTYFVTLVAGPYHSVSAEHDGITLGLHARASLAQYLDVEAAEILSVTGKAFDRYHELFGIRYPFGEYHQAFVPDFNAGAMENPGCVTLRDQYVFRAAATTGERGIRANTIVHELAHMWFGDLVTMRWWDDLWLNESFAEYMAHRVCSEVTEYAAWTEFGIRRKDWGYVADQAPSTHPVAGNGSTDAASALADFDGISYAKGAAALKQLATYLGDEVFFAGLRKYFAEHAYGNAEFSELIAAWTEAGGRDVHGWAKQWLRSSGLDTISAVASHGSITVSRHSPDDTLRPHALRVTGYDGSGAITVDAPVTIHDAAVAFPTRSPVLLVVADSDDDTWAKIRFGDDGWAMVSEQLPQIENSLTRVVIYNAIRDAVRNAELDPLQALEVLLQATQTEAHEFVVADLLHFCTAHLCAAYAPVNERTDRLQRVSQTAGNLLAAAGPGSDQQLVAARAFIRASTDADSLAAWLCGHDIPDGLIIDAELRWALVGRLAAIGMLDAAAIDSELQRDRSTSGVAHAARARSLCPDAEAKVAAWQLLTQASRTPAHELYATAEGFFEPSQDAITADYVNRFFAEMPATAGHRQGWALARLVLLGYPMSSANRTTLGLATCALDRSDLDSGMRRSLVDATDALHRAVRSLERYGHRRALVTDDIGSAYE